MARTRLSFATVFGVGVFSGLIWAQGLLEVEYVVDGSAKFAALTYKNSNGATEQNTVPLPFSLKFYAARGSVAYLSAQKTRVTREDPLHPGQTLVLANGQDGKVHVVVRAGGLILQEAESSSPFGIATASGTVPQ